MEVSHARLAPQDVDMVAVAEVHADCLAGRLEAYEARARLAEACDGRGFSNGFFHGAAGYRRIEAATPA